jgi:hypothetical protein
VGIFHPHAISLFSIILVVAAVPRVMMRTQRVKKRQKMKEKYKNGERKCNLNQREGLLVMTGKRFNGTVFCITVNKVKKNLRLIMSQSKKAY